MQGRPATSPYRDRSDASLMRAAATDPAAFSEIYDRHAGTLYTWFRQRLAWAASDLTAETFARAWLGRARFRDLREGSALPWLHGIAAHVLADAVRRDRIETRARERLGLPLDLASEDGYDDVERRLSPRLAVGRELRSLPDHEREAVELRVLEELPYDQIANRLAIAPAAARLRVSRALRRLAEEAARRDLAAGGRSRTRVRIRLGVAGAVGLAAVLAAVVLVSTATTRSCNRPPRTSCVVLVKGAQPPP